MIDSDDDFESGISKENALFYSIEEITIDV